MSFELNYSDAFHLDAEALAEGGIAEAYESLSTALRRFVKCPEAVEEKLDNDLPSYSVSCGSMQFCIYGPDFDEGAGESWGRATVALFAIVNDQLKDSSHRFYAINGGNDLFGIFLTPQEAAAAQRSLHNKTDWPYIPQDGNEWFGQYH
jgi:hypothetical protein